MLPSEVRRLPRPLLAYGLIMESTDVVACLSLADGVVLGLDVATAVAPALMQVLDKEADPRRNLSTRS
jgi:hypothetical protein